MVNENNNNNIKKKNSSNIFSAFTDVFKYMFMGLKAIYNLITSPLKSAYSKTSSKVPINSPI